MREHTRNHSNAGSLPRFSRLRVEPIHRGGDSAFNPADDRTACAIDCFTHGPSLRLGKPSEIGQAAVYLASTSAEYITGETIIISGGWVID